MYCNYLQDTVLNPVDSYFSDENLSFESCFNYETFKCRSSLPASPEEIRAETGFNRSISLALEDFATCMNRIATEFKFLVQFERRSYILQNDSYDEIDDGIQRNQRTLSLVKPNLCRARDFTFRTDCCIYLNDPNIKKSCPVLIGDLKCSPDDWQQAIMQLILYMYIGQRSVAPRTTLLPGFVLTRSAGYLLVLQVNAWNERPLFDIVSLKKFTFAEVTYCLLICLLILHKY